MSLACTKDELICDAESLLANALTKRVSGIPALKMIDSPQRTEDTDDEYSSFVEENLSHSTLKRQGSYREFPEMQSRASSRRSMLRAASCRNLSLTAGSNRDEFGRRNLFKSHSFEEEVSPDIESLKKKDSRRSIFKSKGGSSKSLKPDSDVTSSAGRRQQPMLKSSRTIVRSAVLSDTVASPTKPRPCFKSSMKRQPSGRSLFSSKRCQSAGTLDPKPGTVSAENESLNPLAKQESTRPTRGMFRSKSWESCRNLTFAIDEKDERTSSRSSSQKNLSSKEDESFRAIPLPSQPVEVMEKSPTKRMRSRFQRRASPRSFMISAVETELETENRPINLIKQNSWTQETPVNRRRALAPSRGFQSQRVLNYQPDDDDDDDDDDDSSNDKLKVPSIEEAPKKSPRRQDDRELHPDSASSKESNSKNSVAKEATPSRTPLAFVMGALTPLVLPMLQLLLFKAKRIGRCIAGTAKTYSPICLQAGRQAAASIANHPAMRKSTALCLDCALHVASVFVSLFSFVVSTTMHIVTGFTYWLVDQSFFRKIMVFLFARNGATAAAPEQEPLLSSQDTARNSLGASKRDSLYLSASKKSVWQKMKPKRNKQ